ncbi:MAG: hypothetical protein EP339_14005 [Gammaproteobacteria bacterium]|nr:MAG: hypothetical protein EP339_14005 [Gammaproteobacteria bacterium]
MISSTARIGRSLRLIVILALGLFLASQSLAGKGNGKGGGGGGQTTTSESSVMPSYRGSAKALDVTVNLLGTSTPIIISDTGELNSTGGSKDESLIEVNEDIVQAAVLKATAVGSGNQVDSMAQTLGLQLDLSSLGIPLTIGASVLESGVTALCTDGSEVLKGYSDIVELNVNGQEILDLDTSPNQVIPPMPLSGLLSGVAQITVNEQFTDDYGMTVRALHVEVLNLLGAPVAEVIISEARGGLDCGSGPDGECPPAADFITGGARHDNVTATVHGGIFPNGELKGGLNFNDKQGSHINTRMIAGYEMGDTPTTRILYFLDEDSGECKVTVADNGEPGRDDTFAIACDSGPNTSFTLTQGGNFQLHQPKACPSSSDSTKGGGNGKKKK